ncbi:uncharacterized protein TNCV_4657171 [Trichonephila clavipes]|nr:uncharacterized protein TNCV_4657171 [Trichonephila clavipes]
MNNITCPIRKTLNQKNLESERTRSWENDDSTVERRLSERLLFGASNIRTGFFLSTPCTVYEYVSEQYYADLGGEKDFNDDHREEITYFIQSIPEFQECNEDAETWMTCDAEDCGFQMLNDDEIVTSVQEESDTIDDETDNYNNNESSKGP